MIKLMTGAHHTIALLMDLIPVETLGPSNQHVCLNEIQTNLASSMESMGGPRDIFLRHWSQVEGKLTLTYTLDWGFYNVAVCTLYMERVVVSKPQRPMVKPAKLHSEPQKGSGFIFLTMWKKSQSSKEPRAFVCANYNI